MVEKQVASNSQANEKVVNHKIQNNNFVEISVP